MMVIRPVAPKDLGDLLALAAEAGAGMTNLPADPERLTNKIAQSVASFDDPEHDPQDALYFFVLEDPTTARVVGTAGLVTGVGYRRPFYTFRRLTLVNTSRELDCHQPLTVLQMVDDFRGATELGMLYLAPPYRRDHLGRFLSKSRFVFMAQQPARFGDLVIAELRGVVDDQGHSPFWAALGQHFFPMDYRRADWLSALGHHQFIADLMPKHPIYTCLLPLTAQAVIGHTHPHTAPARRLLEGEGFRFEGSVDVFDAGPTVQCPLKNIATLRDCRAVTVTAALEPAPSGDPFIVAHGPRLVMTTIQRTGFRQVGLPSAAIAALHLALGTTVYIAPL